MPLYRITLISVFVKIQSLAHSRDITAEVPQLPCAESWFLGPGVSALQPLHAMQFLIMTAATSTPSARTRYP